jgi:membrane-bound lytic murein transglycosylase D
MIKKFLKYLTLLSLFFISACSTTNNQFFDKKNLSSQTEKNNAPQTSVGVATSTKSGAYSLIPAGELHPVYLYQTEPMPVAHIFVGNDLWERTRKNFSIPDLNNELVRQQEQWYISRPDYIYRMVERSRKYLFHIVEELERRSMPGELALLPYIESAFNPQAVSVAKAAGMWQFMPATGKGFDLKQNAFRDDRRDVLASTRAALDYLQSLYNMFDDWHLALAAYNWGQGNVRKAIERNRRMGLEIGYQELNMPNETRLYVPKLQAVKNIIKNPLQYNVNLPVIENHPFFDTVTLTRDIDISLAARLAEVDEDDFKALNPSVNKPIIMAAGTPHILLPWEKAAVFQRNLQFHVGPLASWTAWAVPSHMRTSDIAKKFGIQEQDLRQINRIPPSVLVKAGSTVLVPRTEEHKGNVPEHVADHGSIEFQSETRLQKSNIKVAKGDTISSIAKRLKISESELADWNRLSVKSALKVGQILTIIRTVAVKPQPVATSVTSRKLVSTSQKTRASVSIQKTRVTLKSQKRK